EADDPVLDRMCLLGTRPDACNLQTFLRMRANNAGEDEAVALPVAMGSGSFDLVWWPGHPGLVLSLKHDTIEVYDTETGAMTPLVSDSQGFGSQFSFVDERHAVIGPCWPFDVVDLETAEVEHLVVGDPLPDVLRGKSLRRPLCDGSRLFHKADEDVRALAPTWLSPNER